MDRFKRKPDPEVGALRSLLEQQRDMLGAQEALTRHLRKEMTTLKEAESGWRDLYGTEDDRELDDTKREAIRKKCIEVFYKTPEGRAIIKNLTNYIVGSGVSWTCQDENPDVQKFVDDICLSPKVRFDRRQRSIVSRTLRDGELFVHILADQMGETYALRFYPPGEITEVKLDPQDAETVQEYKREWTGPDNKKQSKSIPADEIHHIKLDVDEDVPRGRPLMEPILKRLTQYEKWLNGRITINEAKSNIVLEKIVTGSPSRVATVASSLPGTTKSAFTDDEFAVQMPRPGTVAVHSDTIKYQWTGANINAEDCKEDGRQIRLSIAAGVCMPEFLLTSDSSNANYSSTIIAESPFVKFVEACRFFFEQEFKLLFGRMIQKGIAGKSLPETSTETIMSESARKKVNILKAMKEQAVDELQKGEYDKKIAEVNGEEENYEENTIPTNTEVDFEWPSIVTRNLFEETQAIEIHLNNKLVSKRTAQMRLGYDPDEEERLMEKEREETEPDPYVQMQDEIERIKAEMAAKSPVIPSPGV